jgi:CRP/FNR family transcriptional regulator, anaerobic regulatory protein
MRTVIEFLHSFMPMSEGLKMHLYENLRPEKVRKRVKMLRPGHLCERIFFVERGLFRCYVRRGEKEICKWFMREGDVVISVNSFFNQVPSTETIESLEDSDIYSITFTQLQETYRLFPEFRALGQFLTEKYYCLSEVKADDLRMKTPDELYSDWLKNQKELAGRVFNAHLASYLGVDVSTLSRIRSQKKRRI